MQKMSFRDLIDQDTLQRVQNEFCQVAGIAAYCVDGDHNRITMPSGDAKLLEWLRSESCADQVATVLERVQEGSLEDQAVEELEDGTGHIASIAVRVGENTVIYWVVFESSTTENIHFYHILDLIRDISQMIFAQKISNVSAEAESRRSHYAEEEMSRTLGMGEATTEIVQLLDSDEQFELVLDKWLRTVAQHIQVDTAELFRLYADSDKMDVVCEWRKAGTISFFDKTSQVATYSFLHTGKPLVISGDSLKNEYQNEIDAIGMKAVIIFPVIEDEEGNGIVLSLNHREENHVWSMAEIKFVMDSVKILRSILEGRRKKISLAGAKASLESILDNVGCPIYVTDVHSEEVLFANRRLQSTFAMELKNGSFPLLLRQGVERAEGRDTGEIYNAERERWYDLIYKEIPWVDGRRAMLYSLYDITDKKTYKKRVEQQAYMDFLTGLYNRMCCERDLARQIDEAKRLGQKGALLYLDLDNFKHINEGLGHQYGDALLKAISHAFQRIEGIENTCYRMGGDEFVIIVSPKAYERFDEIMQQIKSIFEKPWFLKDADYYCTMSMGVVVYPDVGDYVTDLIKKADIAMYEAKKMGKNCVARYSEGNDVVLGKRLNMEKNMRDAAIEGYKEFEVYYQPIVDIQNGNPYCVGAEALIRWNSEKLGFVAPSEFIPLAEYLGLINPIGNFVLREACGHCKEWNDKGYNYKVNVNLSVVQLLQPDILENVKSALRETGLEPQNLTLEVTESLAINDMERMKVILNSIKELGVSLALDDFGTGYSSLNHIREIPVDVIKVDQSFVKELAEDAYSQSFIKMVAELAETIGMSVCVEGIETASQYKVLQNMKVKYIQGFYFDRPMPKKVFEEKYLR